MNTDKVFTGFNKEGEVLIYRENSETYIDLIKKTNIKKDSIDLETLKKLSETLRTLKYMPESIITKLYNYDRSKTIETKNILFGLKGTVTNFKTTKVENGWYYHGMPMHNYYHDWDLKDKEMGLYVFFKKIILDKEYEFKLYKNLNDGKNYIGFDNNFCKISSFNNGFEYVYFNKITLKDMIKEPYVTKKKVYEYANATRKEKVE